MAVALIGPVPGAVPLWSILLIIAVKAIMVIAIPPWVGRGGIAGLLGQDGGEGGQISQVKCKACHDGYSTRSLEQEGH